VLVVLGSATPQRLWSVRAEDPPEFVVAKPDGYEPIPPWMDGQYTTVEVPPGWKVLRRKD
jgi:ferredoxin-NADP reductase